MRPPKGAAAGLAAAAAISLSLSACVQTRQFADVQFAPPSGDYKLLVMRPDITVSKVTTGGIAEPRADWTEASRRYVIQAIRAQQSETGGEVLVADSFDDVPNFPTDKVIELDRLHSAVGSMIVTHRYRNDRLPTKKGQGLDWTLGDQAVAMGKATGYDYALFLHAQDSFASDGRKALQVLGILGCVVGFCAPNIGGGGQFAYASLVDLRSGDVVWFNMLQAGTQFAGVNMGDIRSPAGAEQMVERLLGKMKPGKAVRQQMKAEAAS